MATIISERTWRNRVKRRYEITLTDLNGVEHTEVIGPVVVDASDDGSTIESSLLESKKVQEDESVIDADNPLTLALNPQWSTTKRIAKYAIRWMMKEKDPYIVIHLEPLITHIQQNYTAAQVANLLDLTTEQVQRMNNRVNAILTDTGTVKDQLTIFDSNQEEIE